MSHFQPGTSPEETQISFYVAISFVGGIIRNISMLMLVIWYTFAAAAAAVDTAKSIWHHPEFRRFLAAMEADLSDKVSSAVDLNRQLPSQFKDLEKVQRDENRARRKLALELRKRKTSASGFKAVRHYGRLI